MKTQTVVILSEDDDPARHVQSEQNSADPSVVIAATGRDL